MKELLRLSIELPLYYLSGLFPRKKNRIIFGAWKGKKYSDNSKYMCEYLSDLDKFELIWCSKNEQIIPFLPKNVKFVKYGSLQSFFYVLTSKYAFVTHSFDDIVKFNIFKGAKIIQLWHGIGIKNIGELTVKDITIKEKLKRKIRSIIRKYDYFICSSKQNEKRNMLAFASYGITPKNIIKSGQPRNDFLLEVKYNNDIRNNILIKYNLPTDKKIITYLPTFRKKSNNSFSFLNLSNKIENKIIKILKKQNAIILEKNHDSISCNIKKTNKKSIFNLNNNININTQELLLITDLLITDYSSCYIDYLLLDRPIIHFAYDYDDYINNEQGFYYDFNEIVGGDIVKNIEDLFIKIDECLTNPKKGENKRQKSKEIMLEYEKGKSREEICNKIGIL